MVVSNAFTGTILLTDTYQMIYPTVDNDHIRDPYWCEGWVFLHEMTAGDIVQIKFSTYDAQGQVMRVYDQPIISGVQEPVSAFHLGAILTPWFRVEIKQTVAPSSYKNINFLFYEVS